MGLESRAGNQKTIKRTHYIDYQGMVKSEVKSSGRYPLSKTSISVTAESSQERPIDGIYIPEFKGRRLPAALSFKRIRMEHAAKQELKAMKKQRDIKFVSDKVVHIERLSRYGKVLSTIDYGHTNDSDVFLDVRGVTPNGKEVGRPYYPNGSAGNPVEVFISRKLDEFSIIRTLRKAVRDERKKAAKVDIS